MEPAEQPDTSSSRAEVGEPVTLYSRVTLRATRDRRSRTLVLELDVWCPSDTGDVLLEELLPGDDFVDGHLMHCAFKFAWNGAPPGKRSVVREFPNAPAYRYVALTYESHVVTVAQVEDV